MTSCSFYIANFLPRGYRVGLISCWKVICRQPPLCGVRRRRIRRRCILFPRVCLAPPPGWRPGWFDLRCGYPHICCSNLSRTRFCLRDIWDHTTNHLRLCRHSGHATQTSRNVRDVVDVPVAVASLHSHLQLIKVSSVWSLLGPV